MYARDLKLSKTQHQAALFAPKAIGPKIWQLFEESRPHHHRLVAGFHAPQERKAQLHAMAEAMGFAPEHLVEASFDQETIGDLLSEQGLLCGGVFTLLEWTLEAMTDAGVPAGLIREECLTELELIAGLLRERGPASTFSNISQAAQCGTVLMQESLNASNVRELFQKRLSAVLDRSFVETFQSKEWKPKAQALHKRLEHWQAKLKGTPSL
jgi:ketol-acid reductoisomerase